MQSELASAPAEVFLIAAAPSADTVQHLASELRREALRVDVATADVLRMPPAATVYVFCFDAAIAIAVADRVAAWADHDGQCAGLIGVIEDGGGHEREALLAAGFDDVVAGRLSTRELSARVRAVHRRMQRGQDSHGRLRFASFTLDPDNYALWAFGTSVPLTPIELAVMRELMKARGRPLSRAKLLDAAWGEGELEVSERAVDNVILRLRRKLPNPDAIETVRGVGFRLGG
ncbi:MAG TPA: response regulator transcription factor [Kofleriaceae bacterium]